MSSEQEMVNKRSSSFFPLRGKKPSLDSPEIPFGYPLMSSQQLDDKRSQFYPLRGKKIPTELKRASYFMPMRGRKDDQDWSEEEGMEKRMSSFMPMRGRKDGEEDSLEKRMSSFMPMRGRKDDDDSVDEEESMEKRMSSFMPMRGRKDDNESLEKRMSSFMPMRGKKRSGPEGYVKSGMYAKEIMNLPSSSSSISNQFAFIPVQGGPESNDLMENTTRPMDHSSQKRSISPMRGIKSLSEIQNEFPGVGQIDTSLLEKRGSSFMPMRGRKDSFEKENESLDSEEYMPMSETRNVMPEAQNYDGFEKKASSFMAMRGRRTLDPWNFNDEITSKEKRRRSQFMPMRGRREYNPSVRNLLPPDSLSDEQVKRAVSFMAMRGRRFNESPLERHLSSAGLKDFPVTLGIGNSPDINRIADNQTEESMADLAEDDKRASSFMPMRGRRRTDYFYHPYSYHIPSGIGSSLMTPLYSGKVFPISSPWSRATKHRKFDWDSVKRAFHATRGKRSSNGDTGKEPENFHPVPDQDDPNDDSGVHRSQVPDRGAPVAHRNQAQDLEVPGAHRSHVPGRDAPVAQRSQAQDLEVPGAHKSHVPGQDALGAQRSLYNDLETTHQWPTQGESSVEQDHEGKGCRCKRSILTPRIFVKSQRQYIGIRKLLSLHFG